MLTSRRGCYECHRFHPDDCVSAISILQQETDLTADHGILRHTGPITITAETVEDLDSHVATLEQAAIQANCETRLLVGQQAQAFTAAALPPLCRQV